MGRMGVDEPIPMGRAYQLDKMFATLINIPWLPPGISQSPNTDKRKSENYFSVLHKSNGIEKNLHTVDLNRVFFFCFCFFYWGWKGCPRRHVKTS